MQIKIKFVRKRHFLLLFGGIRDACKNVVLHFQPRPAAGIWWGRGCSGCGPEQRQRKLVVTLLNDQLKRVQFQKPKLVFVIALTWGILNCKTFYSYLFLTESIFYTLMVNQKFGWMFNCIYHRYYETLDITILHNIFCKWRENDNISNCKLHIYLIDLIIIGFTSNIEHYIILSNCILTLI